MSSHSQEPLAPGGSFGSGYTLPSRQLPVSDPLISKRVCFYKSGDYTFNGHRMVINARTFKTFDALLDALSKKVPLAFGVRTITTPRGIHFVKGLDDLYDGGSYVCSDQKRVKPIILKELNRRQIPWNTTKPRRRRQGVIIESIRKVTERVAIRTPKRLEVIKNRDPSVRRTIILQKRTAPTFDALLDYLSQILQFPVLKLYSTDGRRVDGLAALILCSGIIVAAGNEPFKLGNYRFPRSSQMAQGMFMETSEASIPQPQAYNNKYPVYGKGSRKFSPSSERYIVNQINNSRYGNLNSPRFPNGPVDPETAIETCANTTIENQCHTSIIPQDEDIEKSFRVNQDGSMTVEMKVRLKIKEEEMLHWTTTLSRTSLSKQTAYPMISESANSSPDCNNAMSKKRNVSKKETKEPNLPAETKSSVGFIEEKLSDTPEVIERKSIYKRAPTPGPGHVKKKGIKAIPHSELQELDQYTYMKRTSDKDTTEEYHVVRHSSSRSSRPVPKPRKKSSNNGVAEVLQVEHNRFGVKETVMHIYESQGCYDAYFVNEQCTADSVPLDGSSPAARPANDGIQSSSNDCDIDSCWQPPVVDPVQHQNEEILSLSSEPLSASCKITNNLSSVTENLAQNMSLQDNVVKANKGNRKRIAKHAEKQTSLRGSFDKKPEKFRGATKNSKNTYSDKLSNKASVGKKSSIDSVKNGQKSALTEKLQTKKVIGDKSSIKEKVTTDSNTISPTKVAPYNGHNVNVPDTKTSTNKMKKSISDILKPKKSLPANQITISTKSKSVNKNAHFSKKPISESSAPIPSVNPSPSEIHQYVENWLEKVSPEVVPYMDEDLKSQSKVEFQLGDDSEVEEKNQSQFYMENNSTSSEDIKKSDSSLLVPVCQEGTILSAVSMPTLREASQDVRIKLHKSDVGINCGSNIISSPKDKLQPVIHQIFSFVQCINRASYSNTKSRIAKSNSLPDFSSQVASVFGSSCKTFLSFLSMMTLRDSLTGFAPSHGSNPRLSSEAMLMMESLQKISTIDNGKKQRASLSDLQNKASSQLKEQWQDYKMTRGKSESELASSKISESKIDVCQNMKEFGDEHLGIIELMDEVNMPADVRAEISTAIQQAFSFYPIGESSMTEIKQNQSVLKEEQIVKRADVSGNSNHEADLEENNLMETERKEKEITGDEEEVTITEDAKTENLDGSLISSKGQGSEVNKEVEEESSDVKQADLSDDVMKNRSTDQDSENAEEKEGDKRTVDSTVDDGQTEVISEKNDLEEEGEDEDQFEDTDSNIVVHGGKEVSEEAGEEHSQELLQEEQISEDDVIGNASDNQGDRNESAIIDDRCDQVSIGSVPEDAASKNLLEEALYLECENSSCDEVKSESLQDTSIKSTSKYSSEGKCLEDKCNRSHSISELETEAIENYNLTNPVEISQELLDFVNSALQSSSLIFTYDSHGNVTVATNVKPAHTTGRDSSYGFNCLPSPNTSELTDYRPESLESGGYKTEESLDIVTESEDLDTPFPVCKHSAHKTQDISNEQASLARTDSKLSPVTSKSSLSTNDSGTKISRENLSDFSTASSLKADNDHAPETEQCVSPVPGKHSPDGVLIDHGRWLLKENHLIRKSPPESSGMYGNIDTSIDTSVAEDSPTHYQALANPLTALSSSELEEMARPPTPKCNYYNMPHGSDSDPFLDDASIKSGKKEIRDIKVEPQVDTTKTWGNKDGSLSSFTSMEFKMSDRKVHPEVESSAVVQARRTSSGEQSVVQAQDSGETLQWRCNQYCPIL